MQEMNVPETEEEKKLINTRYQRYYNTVFCKDHIEELERLKSLLGENLSRNCKVAPISSVAYCDDNIVLKVFPELQEKMHKGLINLKDLDPVLPGVYKMGDYLLFAHRYLRRNCSLQNAFNNEFLDKFQNLIYTNLKVQIALDLDMIGLAGTEKQEAEYQFWWGPKFEDSSYEQNIAMKVPAAPLVVSSAVKDNDKAKEAVYAFLKYYYGEEAAKISYEGSIFPATNYDGIAATDSQYAMNAMITALGNGWKTPKAAPDQTVTPAVQEAMYDAIFGVMQGTYSPKDALKNMDSAAAN